MAVTTDELLSELEQDKEAMEQARKEMEEKVKRHDDKLI